MVSLRRRQVMIAGLAAAILPAVSFATGATPEKLILSGRLLGRDGKPVAGASLSAGAARVTTDADGRFVVVTDTRSAERFIANAQRDAEDTWRATVALSLA